MIYPKQTTTRNDVALHYDELDRFYRELWGEHVHHGLWLTGRESQGTAVRQLVELVARHARIGQGSKVCDVGAGYGATARYLAQEKGARVTALTVSGAQYQYARARSTGDNPAYLLCDWLENSFPSASFDAVIAIESLAHMTDKRRFFVEAERVLRPGGRLVVCAWLAGEGVRPWEERYLLEPICREGRLPGLGTASEYLELLTGAGLTQEMFEDLSVQVRKTWTLCVRDVLSGILHKPDYRAFLLSNVNQNRIFALTVLRIWLAYRTGAFHYGLFAARKP